jgi:hypothetical protein
MNSNEPNTKALGIAKLNWAGPDSWCVYADGYKRAAELLIERTKNIYETNTVIFPILALYRHYVELSLKEIIAYGQYLDGKGSIPDNEHDLKQLWACAKNYIRKSYTAFEQLSRIEQLVYEIYDLDPTSQGARYPYVKHVKPKDKNKRAKVVSFSAAPLFLRLDLLNADIHELGELLSDVTAYLSISQDLEAEARSILRENYP